MKLHFWKFQRIQEEKRIREAEIKRREAERKIRHERLIHDGKKSFFELNQISTENVQAEQKSEDGKISTQTTNDVPIEKNTTEKQLSTVDGAKIDDPMGKNENDLNALDYEADKDDNIDEPETAVTVQRVEIEQHKTHEKSSKSDKHNDEKSHKRNDDTKKVDRRRRSRSRDKHSKTRDRDWRHNSRSRNDRRVYNRRRDYSPYRDNRRRDARDRFNKNSPSHDRRRRNRDSR